MARALGSGRHSALKAPPLPPPRGKFEFLSSPPIAQAGLLFLLGGGGGAAAGWWHARRLVGAARGLARGLACDLQAAATQACSTAEQRVAALHGACTRSVAALATQAEGVQQIAVRQLAALKLSE